MSTPPGSPFRARPPPVRTQSRPQSPGPGISSPIPTYPHAPLAIPPAPPSPLEFDLALLEIPRSSETPVALDTPFTVKLAITLASLPPQNAGTPHRVVSFAIQHIQPARIVATPTALSAALTSTLMHPPSRASTPSPTPSALASGRSSSVVISRTASIVSTETLVESPTASHWAPSALSGGTTVIGGPNTSTGLGTTAVGPRMPPPFPLDDTPGVGRGPPTDGVVFVGNSCLTLPSFVFSRPEGLPSQSAQEETNAVGPLADADRSQSPSVGRGIRQELSQEFTLSYLATRPGFAAIGGLRLLLLSDEERVNTQTGGILPEPRILKEWDVIGEVYVSS